MLRRIKALQGFGTQKTQIFLALLAKQRGVQPAEWREAARAYGEDAAQRRRSRRRVARVAGATSSVDRRGGYLPSPVQPGGSVHATGRHSGVRSAAPGRDAGNRRRH